MTNDSSRWTSLSPATPPDLSQGQGHVVVLVSASGGRASAEQAIAVARSWSEAGRRVVLADLSLEAPILHGVLDQPNGEGVSDAVSLGASVGRVAQRIPDSRMFFVPAGTPVADAAALFQEPRWKALCQGFIDAGATLVVFLPLEAAGRAAIMELATDVVLLGQEETDMAAVTEEAGDRIRSRILVAAPADAVATPADSEAAPSDSADPVAEVYVDELAPDAEADPEPDLQPDMGSALEMEAEDDGAIDSGVVGENQGWEDEAPTEEDDVVSVSDLAPDDGAEWEEEIADEDAFADESVAETQEVAREGVADANGLGLDDFEEDSESQGEWSAGDSVDFGELAPAEATDSDLRAVDEEFGASDPEKVPGRDVGDSDESETSELMDEPTQGGPPVPLADEILAEAGDAPDEPYPDAFEGELSPPPRRRSSRLLLLLLVVAGAAAAWWFGYLEIPGVPAPVSQTPEVPQQQVSRLSAAEPRQADSPTDAPTDVSPAAAWSVTLESHSEVATAQARIDALRAAAPEFLWTRVPVEVDGTVFHRVVVGPAVDEPAARALAERVSGLLGASSDSWVIRPTPRAFRLDELPTLDAAQDLLSELNDEGIPAYTLAVSYSDDSGAFRVYAGGYEDAAEAAALEALLADAGKGDVMLVDRRGTAVE